MQFSEIFTEIVNFRFNGANVASAKFWVNLRYGVVMNDKTWTFLAARANVTVTSGSNAVTGVPADFGQIVSVLRDDGTPLVYITPTDFDRTFYGNLSTAGTPGYYTVVAGTLQVGPTPSATSGTYEIIYNRKWVKLVNDADVPVIPEEYHYMLVHGGLATGLTMANDFTWEFQEQQFAQLLQSMRDTYTSDYGGTLQYVRDNSGLEPPRF